MKRTLPRMRNGKPNDGNGECSTRVDYIERWNSTSARTIGATIHNRGSKYERNRSRGITVVMLQYTSESMFAFNFAEIKRNDVVFVVRFSARQRQELISQALMGPALMIIGNVLGNNVVEVRFAEDQEVVEGFLFCRLYPHLDVGVKTRRQALARRRNPKIRVAAAPSNDC